MTSRTFDLHDHVRREAAAVASPAPYASVTASTDAAAVLDAWAELEMSTPCSIYQTRAFILPWADTLGRKAGLEPRFVLARDRDGSAAALLCLGLARRGPSRVATWLGGKDANFNLPLLRRPSAWTRTDILHLLRDAARACGASAPDVFDLPNQPLAWSGVDNAFAQLPHSESPSAAHGTRLPPTAEALFAGKLSKDTRKKLRKKEARLATVGAITHVIASCAEDQAKIIDTFLAQKTARFRDLGIASDFEAPEMRDFIERASAPGGHGIELHALCAGDRIVAVYGGAAHDRQWSGMFNAFDADEEIAKSSPGDLLLMRIMERCCADGLARFDLGIGEARYKAALCDEPIPLFDAFVAVSLRGHAYVACARAKQAAKRRIKQNPKLMALLKRLRAATA